MKLPKLDVRMFQVALPSTGQKLTLRPFLVSEERILLEAARTENQVEIANAMKQIVNNCVTEEIDLLFSGIIATAKYFVLIAAQSVIPFKVTLSESPDPTFKFSSSPP